MRRRQWCSDKQDREACPSLGKAFPIVSYNSVMGHEVSVVSHGRIFFLM